jgi:hypothetical protein
MIGAIAVRKSRRGVGEGALSQGEALTTSADLARYAPDAAGRAPAKFGVVR